MKNKDKQKVSKKKRPSKPIRVLHYIGSLNIGGSQTMIMNVYRNIDRKKIQFDFIIDRKNEKHFAKEIESLGGKVYALDEFFNGRNYFRFKRQWVDFFRTHPEYKIIHCHVRSVASIVLKIAKKNGLKTICHSHNTSNGTGFKSIIKKRLQSRISKHCDFFVACSEESAKWLYGEKITERSNFQVLNNATDPNEFMFNNNTRQSVRRALGLKDEFVLGQVGRIEPVKNQSFSVEVLKDLLGIGNFHLLIIGTGSKKDDVMRLAHSYNIDRHITILEDRRDVNNLLQAMDCFIMPSLFEGVPMALIEAQFNGLPCVVSDNVSKDAVISRLITFLPLEKRKWIKTLSLLYAKKTRGVSLLPSSEDFSITNTIPKWESLYCKLWGAN